MEVEGNIWTHKPGEREKGSGTSLRVELESECGSCSGQCPPTRCPPANPGPCEYMTLHDKRDFAVVIKSMALRWREGPGVHRWAQSNHVGKRENLVRLCRGDVTAEEWLERRNATGFEDGERGPLDKAGGGACRG